MLDTKIVELLDKQYTRELASAYIYLDIAAYYEDEGLSGFAHWFQVQYEEEVDHAMRIRKYLLDNGQRLGPRHLELPAGEFENHLQPLELALAHEKGITASIHGIYGAALEARDFLTVEFLGWFVTEQLEEEKSAKDLIDWYKLFAKGSQGLQSLDRELGARTAE